ncbi:plasmid replication protein RepC [Sphingomonas sp. TREG-RG-20F-R18-01]|uniref:plasmid replication protein RepC n=1 Tax=Sphingomonas sp. TREG-RG-20F-R18-01 TaxID=2914982 RepID=UPI001F5784B6|nr:plasmid replication protein RepC [Sphingomonas sp. TREG-RG-20F-R18-01]
MSYTQTAFTGRTGARPISALTRLIEREVATRLESACDIDRNELYRVLDGAKTAIGLSASALETLKHLIGYTRPNDYKGAARPIAWPSNYTLAELGGVTESAIKARLRQLRNLALITMRDAAHGRRRGQRGASGEIVSAYGIDLTPLRARFDELKAAAEAHSAFSRLDKLGRQEIARVRRMVSQALAQAADMRLTGPHWIMLQEAIETVAQQAAMARSSRDAALYERALADLPEIEDQVGQTIDRFMFHDESNASGSKSSPFIHIQTNPCHDSVTALRERSSDRDSPAPIEPDLPVSPSNSTFKTSPIELVEMFPSTAMYVERPRPSWIDLHRATARLRNDLGIRTGTWVDALDKLGADGAAVAIMITAERSARHEIRLTPGAYFAGMVTRAQRGELDLSKSLWGFRTERAALQ